MNTAPSRDMGPAPMPGQVQPAAVEETTAAQ